MKIKLVNGKLQLTGAGTFCLLSTATVVPAGDTLTITLADYRSSNAGTRPVIQRKAGTIQGDVPVLISFTGSAPAQWEARVVTTGGVTVKDWTALTSVTFNGSTGLGYLTGVQQGIDYLIQTRDGSQPTNTATISNGTQPWGVGVCILYCGQSNMVSTLSAGNYNDAASGTGTDEYSYSNSTAGQARGSFFADVGFHAASNGGNGPIGSSSGSNTASGGAMAIVRVVAAALQAKYGYAVPVCLVPWAMNGSAISAWQPATPGTYLNSLLNGSGSSGYSFGFKSPLNIQPGDFEGMMWHQGEADNGGTRAAYLASLKLLYQGLATFVAPFGRTVSDLFFGPAVLGVYASGANDGVEKIRGAELDLDAYARANNWPKVRAGWNCIDLDPVDGGDQGLHFRDTNQPYQKRSVRRSIQSVLYFLGCSSFSGLGPRVGAVTRSGLVATVTITHEGGTALTTRAGGAPSGWYANTTADFSGTTIAVTAAIASPTTVAVTFPSGTTFPCYLKYMGGAAGSANSYHPDISNALYDNAVYPAGVNAGDQYTGLPLVPTPDAIMVT